MSETQETVAHVEQPEQARASSLLGRIAHHQKTQTWTAIAIEFFDVCS